MATELKPTPVILTYDDYARLPDDGKRYEIISGEAHVTPAPTVTHQKISRNLGFILHKFVKDADLGEVLSAPVDVILDRTEVVQPDLLFVSKDRARIVHDRGIEGPPDLVVEILSDSTGERDRSIKKQLYALYGVAHYWIIDPDAKTLSEMILQENTYNLRATHRGSEKFSPTLFSGMIIDLTDVFPQ